MIYCTKDRKNPIGIVLKLNPKVQPLRFLLPGMLHLPVQLPMPVLYEDPPGRSRILDLILVLSTLCIQQRFARILSQGSGRFQHQRLYGKKRHAISRIWKEYFRSQGFPRTVRKQGGPIDHFGFWLSSSACSSPVSRIYILDDLTNRFLIFAANGSNVRIIKTCSNVSMYDRTV